MRAASSCGVVGVPPARALRPVRCFTELICTVAEAKTRRGSIAAEAARRRASPGDDPRVCASDGPRPSRRLPRVHRRCSQRGRRRLPPRALPRRAPRRASARLTPRCRGSARPKPLFLLAALLHDVGKGYPDASGSRKNHSQSGAELCDAILPRLGLSAEDTIEARHLVAQHLAMYHVATRRDLDDPATSEEFCRLVRGREGLRDLFLLTVADLSTTSPTAMTSWKARMLDELYFAADAHLAGAKDRAFDEARLARVREVSARSLGEALRSSSTPSSTPCPSGYPPGERARGHRAAHAGVAL